MHTRINTNNCVTMFGCLIYFNYILNSPTSLAIEGPVTDSNNRVTCHVHSVEIAFVSRPQLDTVPPRPAWKLHHVQNCVSIINTWYLFARGDSVCEHLKEDQHEQST